MREIIAAIVLLACVVALVFISHKEGIKSGKEGVEKDLVYCIAKKTACAIGIFETYTIRTGETIIQIKTTNYNIAGAGDTTKQGEKK